MTILWVSLRLCLQTIYFCTRLNSRGPYNFVDVLCYDIKETYDCVSDEISLSVFYDQIKKLNLNKVLEANLAVIKLATLEINEQCRSSVVYSYLPRN